jgi:hypothetical protein
MRMLSCVEGLAVAEVENVCVAIWRGEVTHSRFELQRKGLAEVVEHHNERAAFLVVVEAHVPPPSAELRRAGSALIAQYPTLCCAVAVIEAKGFMAAVTRSVLSGMSLVTKPGFPEAHLGSVVEAGKWMAQHVCIEPTALVDAVESVRRELGTSSPGR